MTSSEKLHERIYGPERMVLSQGEWSIRLSARVDHDSSPLTHFHRAVFQGRAIMRAGRASTVLAAVSATADPACASTTGNTAAIFSVTGGALAITVPSSTVNLGSVSRSAKITAQPGALAVTLATSRTAFTLAAGVGDNSAGWNPTLGISVPAAAAGGTYTQGR